MQCNTDDLLKNRIAAQDDHNHPDGQGDSICNRLDQPEPLARDHNEKDDPKEYAQQGQDLSGEIIAARPARAGPRLVSDCITRRLDGPPDGAQVGRDVGRRDLRLFRGE